MSTFNAQLGTNHDGIVTEARSILARIVLVLVVASLAAARALNGGDIPTAPLVLVIITACAAVVWVDHLIRWVRGR
ncbi:hypothetical protein ACH495_24885 [Micromonospora sp. NPDC018662]|uniref:hypothetical protein n=1 Tax=Micromonospora sp. NPDC018662 TaxID=3364238 RepID=UPI00379268E3